MLPAVERLIEAQGRKKLDPVIRRLTLSLAKAFRSQGKLVGRTVKAGDVNWVLRFYEAATKTAPLFVGPIQKSAEQSLVIGGEQAIASFGLQLAFDLKNPRAVAFLDKYGARRVTKIEETTRDYLNTLLKKAVEEGWSAKKTAEAIIARYEEFAIGKPQAHIQSRAHLIAVTETGEAYAEANMMVAQDLQDAGITMEKFWSTVGDSKVSKGCHENEKAGWISLNKDFPSGHQRPLRFPGCRCDLLTRRKK